jgi:hypothetical protein
MHENRETCSASVNHPDRSAKAQSRTADAYALQESDRCVVPMKLPNREGQSSTEVVGKAAAQGERRTIQHQSDTERGSGHRAVGVSQDAPWATVASSRR